MKYFLLLIIALMTGCFSPERSISNQPEYSQFIGAQFLATEPFFLTTWGNKKLLQPEKRSPIETGPTIDEFRRGEWKNDWRGVQYLEILPAGTAFEICDITYEFHIEMGHTTRWYMRIQGRDGAANNPPMEILRKPIYTKNELKIPGMNRIK
jgi:hypothetical protein